MTQSKRDTTPQGDIIKTRPFRTTSGDYFAVLLSEWLPRYGWTLFIPILATAGYGALRHDERWLLVALMLVFIVVPMLMSFLYTYYMLTPEARRAVLCKCVEIVPGSHIRLTYVDSDEMGEEEQKATATDKSDDTPLPPAEVIDWSDVVRTRRTSRFVVYFLRGERMQFLLIPRCAMTVV